MQKVFLLISSFSGLIAVVLGAFGAHFLKTRISVEAISMWEKGIQYQFYHTLAILFCIYYSQTKSSSMLRNAALCFTVGIFCFSGSLYFLATRELNGIPSSLLGPVTPIGGLFFIAGWSYLTFFFVRD